MLNGLVCGPKPRVKHVRRHKKKTWYKLFTGVINSSLLFLSCFECRPTSHRRARGLLWFRFRTGGSKVSAVEHLIADLEL